MMSPRRRLGVLANREFRKVFAAYSLSAIGDGVQVFALTFLVLEIGGGAAQLAIVLAAVQLPTVALSLFSGVWADRLERRRLLLISDVICGACQLAIAIPALAGHGVIWTLVVFGVVFGCARSVFVPALSGLLPAIVDPSELRQANSLLQTVRASTYIAGAPLATVVIAVSSPAVAVLIDGLSFAASAALVATMRRPRVAAERAASSGMWQELRGGWDEVRKRRWLLVELLRSCVDLPLAIAPMMVLGPIIAAQRLGGASSWATVVTAFLVGSLLGPVIAHWYRPARPMLVCTVLMYTGAISPILLAFTGWVWAIAAAEFAKGCVVGFFGTLWATLLQEKVPDEVRSRVSAWDFTLTTGLQPFGILLVAPLTHFIGDKALLTAGGVWIIVGVSLALLVPSVRRLRWDDNETALTGQEITVQAHTDESRRM